MSNDFSLVCPVCESTLFDANITHNLNKMAEQAGIYACLWHPNDDREEYPNYETADLLIPILVEGLNQLRDRYEFFQQFNPKNGWGTYEGFVKFTSNVLEACRKYPKSRPEAWI